MATRKRPRFASRLTGLGLAALFSLAGCTSSGSGKSSSGAASSTASPVTASPGSTASPGRIAIPSSAPGIAVSATSATTAAPVAATASAGSAAASGAVTLDVEVPSWTTGSLYASCDQAQGSNAAWTPNGVPLTLSSTGRYTGTITAPAGTVVNFKITRGSWATVEKGPQDEELNNRQATSGTSGASTYAHVFHWADDTSFAAAASVRDIGSFSPVVLQSVPREVWVHLPAGYSDPANAGVKWPVCYAMDGQNLFFASMSFSGVAWGLDVADDNNAAAGGQGFIAVGIDNTANRIGEYTPSVDPTVGQGGDLDAFAQFVFTEVKPTIDYLYSTSPVPDDTCIMGSSLGGLAAIWIGFEHPDWVHRVAALSPSLWWDNCQTLGMIQGTTSMPPLTKLWLDIGTDEGTSPSDSATTVQQTEQVEQALENLGFTLNGTLGYMEAQGAQHNEYYWAQRLPQVLAFVFP
jgi:pullulanase